MLRLSEYALPPAFDPEEAWRLRGSAREAYLESRNATRAFQMALVDLAKRPGETLLLDAGSYYLDPLTVAQLRALGRREFGPGVWSERAYADSALALEDARNVTIRGEGATLYAGLNARRVLLLIRCQGVVVEGRVRVVGCSARATQAPWVSTEHDGLLAVLHNSSDVTLRNWELYHGSGDGLNVNGSLYVEGKIYNPQTDRFEPTGAVHNLMVDGVTIRERWGNGVRPWSEGGSRSRLAVALLDVVGVTIQNSLIWGGVDIEPGADGLHAVDIVVQNNTFSDGPVVENAPSDHPWKVERLVPRGTANAVTIRTYVGFTTPAENVVVGGNVVRNNRFLGAGIVAVENRMVADVEHNVFERGLIRVGTVASNPMRISGVRVAYNRAFGLVRAADHNDAPPLYRESPKSFIELTGEVVNSRFEGNRCRLSGADEACVAERPLVLPHIKPTQRSFDGGGNLFERNANEGPGPAVSVRKAATSIIR